MGRARLNRYKLNPNKYYLYGVLIFVLIVLATLAVQTFIGRLDTGKAYIASQTYRQSSYINEFINTFDNDQIYVDLVSYKESDFLTRRIDYSLIIHNKYILQVMQKFSLGPNDELILASDPTLRIIEFNSSKQIDHKDRAWEFEKERITSLNVESDWPKLIQGRWKSLGIEGIGLNTDQRVQNLENFLSGDKLSHMNFELGR